MPPSSDPAQTPAGSDSLTGRVAVVTGASSGIGARFVRALVGAGARVVVTARREERLAALRDELGTDSVLPCPGDLRADEFPAQLIGAAVSTFGRLDLLVNNAGTSHVKPAAEMTTEEFRQGLELNLVSVFGCSREAHGPMREAGGGSIVNVGSVLGLVGLGRIPQASYTASKGAVVNLTRELAAQWARDGIRVNCIAPGWFHTEMTEELFATEKGRSFIERGAPMRRPGEVSELDGALLFLAGDASSYVTGQTLAVDGGWTAV